MKPTFNLISITYQPISEVEERLYFSIHSDVPPFTFVRSVVADELKGTEKYGPCGVDGVPSHPAGFLFRDEINFKRNL